MQSAACFVFHISDSRLDVVDDYSVFDRLLLLLQPFLRRDMALMVLR